MHDIETVLVSYLDYRHARADIDEQVGENVRLCRLEAELRVGVLGVHKGLVRDVPQHKVTAFDQAGHLVLLVHTAKKNECDVCFDVCFITARKSICMICTSN